MSMFMYFVQVHVHVLVHVHAHVHIHMYMFLFMFMFMLIDMDIGIVSEFVSMQFDIKNVLNIKTCLVWVLKNLKQIKIKKFITKSYGTKNDVPFKKEKLESEMKKLNFENL